MKRWPSCAEMHFCLLPDQHWPFYVHLCPPFLSRSSLATLLPLGFRPLSIHCPSFPAASLSPNRRLFSINMELIGLLALSTLDSHTGVLHLFVLHPTWHASYHRLRRQNATNHLQHRIATSLRSSDSQLSPLKFFTFPHSVSVYYAMFL